VRAQLQSKILASKFFGPVYFSGPNSTKNFLFRPKIFKSKQAIRPLFLNKEGGVGRFLLKGTLVLSFKDLDISFWITTFKDLDVARLCRICWFAPLDGKRWISNNNCTTNSRMLRLCLVWSVKVYRPSHWMFGRIYRILNIDYL